MQISDFDGDFSWATNSLIFNPEILKRDELLFRAALYASGLVGHVDQFCKEKKIGGGHSGLFEIAKNPDLLGAYMMGECVNAGPKNRSRLLRAWQVGDIGRRTLELYLNTTKDSGEKKYRGWGGSFYPEECMVDFGVQPQRGSWPSVKPAELPPSRLGDDPDIVRPNVAPEENSTGIVLGLFRATLS
jgi:hypothetical protein